IIFPIMCVLILLMTVTRVAKVYTEYFVWAEEAARYLMIWMAFLAAIIAAKNNSHFRMTAVAQFLPPKISKAVELLATLLSVAIMSILIYYGYNLIMRQMRNGQLSPILMIPMWIPYLAIPFGLLGMLIRTVIREARALRGKPVESPKEAAK
ncbi:MAG: TRAP transporter small permease, partial [Planctomycetes bacterium]|nr:TRAP transporter small permease [Planctomycetota bacterium]